MSYKRNKGNKSYSEWQYQTYGTLAERVKRKLNVDSTTLENLEFEEFDPPEIKLLDKLEFVKYFLPDTIQYIPVFRLVQVEYEDCYHPIHIL